LTGKTDSNGHFTVFLPPDVYYVVFLYNPQTQLYGMSTGKVGMSGQSTYLGDINVDLVPGPIQKDGLSEAAAYIIGTNPNVVSTAGDGISDGAKVALGIDPFGNYPNVTGVSATLPLPGDAEGVDLTGSSLNSQGQTAYIATGSYGLAIVDATNFQKPVVLSQLQLTGDSTSVDVDPNLKIAAVASNAGGLNLIDVSNPTAPKLLQTIAVNASQVQVVDGVVYATVGGEVQAYDALSGEELDDLVASGGTITALAHEGSFLYTLDSHNYLQVIDISGPFMLARGSVTLAPGATLSSGSSALSVVNGIAYVAVTRYLNTNGLGALSGYITADVSNPDSPKYLNDLPTAAAAGQAIALNGSGIALTVGSDLNGPAVNVFDASNTSTSGQFLTRFDLRQSATAVAIGEGIGFVADGSGGLQVVNYLPFDTRGVPPTASLSLPASAIVGTSSNGTPQVVEGSVLPILANVSDDVQVRNVELLVNGQVVQNAVSFPLNFTAALPSIAQNVSNTVTLQLQAVDTGGNVGLSAPLTVQLVPDPIPPKLISSNVANGSTHGSLFRTISLDFSKPLDESTVNDSTFKLTGPNGVVALQNIEFRRNGAGVLITYPVLAVGNYQFTIDAAHVTGRVGNSLGSTPITSNFTIQSASAEFANPNGGDWSDPNNWDGGVLPGPKEHVLINVKPGAVITFSQGTAVVQSVVTKNPFKLTGGTLEVDGTFEADDLFELAGGTLRKATLAAGPNGRLLFTSQGGTLDGVTAASDLLTSESGASATITDGLTLQKATVHLGNAAGSTYGSLTFLGSQTVGGTGTVLFGKSGGSVNAGYNTTLTLGPNITVAGSSGQLSSVYTNSAIINQGTITADDSGGLVPGFSYDTGFGGGWAGNTADAIDTSGVSNPAPQAVYQTYHYGDNFSYTLAGLTAGSSYSVRLDFAEPSEAAVGQRVFDVTANGTTVLSKFDIFQAAGAKDKAVARTFTATADSSGTITLAFNVDSGQSLVALVNGIQVLSGGTVVQAINAGDEAGGIVAVNPNSFTNQGTLAVSNGEALNVRGLSSEVGTATLSGSGSRLSLDGSGYTIDRGLTATAGQTLILSGSWTNAFGSTISATGARLNVGDPGNSGFNVWVNQGSIIASNSTTDLGGRFTLAGLGTFQRNSGTVNLTGVLDAYASGLVLNGNTGSWNLSGGTLRGGTYSASGGAELVFTSQGGTLDGVTAASDLDLASESGASATITDGLTLQKATVHLGNAAGSTYGSLNFPGSQTVGGTGTVLFGKSGANSVNAGYNTTLTLGPNITVAGSSGYLSGVYTNSAIINQGTITAGSGDSIALNVASFSNQGTMQAAGGGTLDITGTLTNSGTVSADMGSAINITGDFIQNGGTIGIAIAGTSSSLMGVVNVSGNASLGGTLNVSFVNGFAPAAGDNFKVLNFGSRSGTFQTVMSLGLPAGRTLKANYDSGDLTLTVN
jgi:hypothetical protein